MLADRFCRHASQHKRLCTQEPRNPTPYYGCKRATLNASYTKGRHDNTGTPRPRASAAETQQASSGTESRPQGTLSDAEATQALGMGTWRLAGLVDPPFEALVSQVEGFWRHMLGPDLRLYQLPKAYKFMDSLDPDKEAGAFGYMELKPPEKGQPGYPRLMIENRCYQSTVFRKLHLEVAYRQDGLQIVHCVMYPRLEYDLPIVSFDMVGKDGRVSLGCTDACPVAMDRSLPPVYDQLLSELQRQYKLENNRTMPEWGAEIFSDLCIITRPVQPADLANFLKYTIALTQAHMQLGKQTSPVHQNKQNRLADIRQAHQRYAQQHMKNSKTRGVLAAAFTPELADEYMTKVMFDQHIQD